MHKDTVSFQAGEIIEPEPHTAFIIHQGYCRIEVDVATHQGIVTFILGTIDAGEPLFEQELLATCDPTYHTLRYRAESDMVLLRLTNETLPRTVEQWKSMFLSFVRAIFRQLSKLYELAAILSRKKHEFERETRLLRAENVRLQKRLAATEAMAKESRRQHADELANLFIEMARIQQKASDSRQTLMPVSTGAPPPYVFHASQKE